MPEPDAAGVQRIDGRSEVGDLEHDPVPPAGVRERPVRQGVRRAGHAEQQAQVAAVEHGEGRGWP